MMFWALISASVIAKDLRNLPTAEATIRSPGNKFLKEERNGEERNNAKRAVRIRLVRRRAAERNEETERRENRSGPGLVQPRTRAGGDRSAEKIGEADRHSRRS